MRFEGRIAVVTGGSRGIGAACVRELSAGGAQVFFTYRSNIEEANNVASECGATALQCDNGDASAIVATVDTIIEQAGTIDILVNNAGITKDMFFAMMPYDDFKKVLEVNLDGTYHWCKNVSRRMLQDQKGAIVNIASIAGMVGTPGQANYAASKGAVLALSRSIAAELAPKNIRVNTVVPGFIETDMTAVINRRIKRQNSERIALNRFGTPSEIAKTVAFLASDDASYIVAQEIVVDGGLTGAVTF